MSNAKGPWVCPNCNTENPAALESCRRCGRPRREVARRRAKRSRTKRRVGRVIGGLVALAIVAAIVAGAIFVVDNADDEIGPPNFAPRLLPARSS